MAAIWGRGCPLIDRVMDFLAGMAANTHPDSDAADAGFVGEEPVRDVNGHYHRMVLQGIVNGCG
jgi:hypothetical protein